MNRYWFIAMAGLVLAGCGEKEEKSPAVDLRGRLVVDSATTEQRQAQGIQGEYYQRILTVNGADMTFNEFLSKYCPDPNTRNETCQKAFRIKKIDDVGGATKFLPAGLQ